MSFFVRAKEVAAGGRTDTAIELGDGAGTVRSRTPRTIDTRGTDAVGHCRGRSWGSRAVDCAAGAALGR